MPSLTATTPPAVRAALNIQPARPEHVRAITALVNEHARRGDLLPRSQASILESLEDWLVGVLDGRVVACGALYHYNGSLVEVRSLAVADDVKGQGWGSEVVEALLALAKERQVPAVFTLTRAVHFFSRLGFEITDKALYPLKVWKDCQICPLQDHCDETAMALPPAADAARIASHANKTGFSGLNGSPNAHADAANGAEIPALSPRPTGDQASSGGDS